MLPADYNIMSFILKVIQCVNLICKQSQVRHDAVRDRQPHTLRRYVSPSESQQSLFSAYHFVNGCSSLFSPVDCLPALTTGRHLRKYQYVFQPAMSYPERIFHRVEEGVAVYSIYPILSHTYILLPRDTTDEQDTHQRVCLRVVVLTPVGPLQVYVTHLSLRLVKWSQDFFLGHAYIVQHD